MMMTKQMIAVLMATSVVTLSVFAQVAETSEDETAIDNTTVHADEPTLDDLLGIGEEEDDPQPDPAKPEPKPDAEDDTNPELTRELDQRLSGEQASEQFLQAIQEMEEVAIRLAEESDPGIDTQRMQDEIILKLEQIIASAEKNESQQQQQQQGGQPQPGQPRQADQGGKPNPGQQPGQEQTGQQPGEQQANQPGQEQGEQPGQAQGEQEGEQPGQQANNPQNNESNGDNARQGSVRNAELSMQELREGEWGQLPPRLRDELAESLSESFNPVYRAATEAFYRRIAELSQQQAEGAE